MKAEYTKVDNIVQWNVLHITHSDLDAANCAVIMENTFKEVTHKFLSYYKVNEFLKDLELYPTKVNKFDAIILSDLSLTTQQISRLFRVMAVADFAGYFAFLDHHEGSKPLHNPSTNIFVIEGVCGAKLLKGFLEGVFDMKYDHLNEMIELTNDYDLWIHDLPQSKHYQYIFESYTKADKYNDESFMKFVNQYKNGFSYSKIGEEEKKVINRKLAKIKECYDSLNVDIFDGSKIGIIMVDSEFVNEISDMLLNDPSAGLQVIINFSPNGISGSVRAKNKLIPDMNLSKVLNVITETSKVLVGSGHKLAAGYTVNDIKYNTVWAEKLPKVMTAIKLIHDSLLKVYPELK